MGLEGSERGQAGHSSPKKAQASPLSVLTDVFPFFSSLDGGTAAEVVVSYHDLEKGGTTPLTLQSSLVAIQPLFFED